MNERMESGLAIEICLRLGYAVATGEAERQMTLRTAIQAYYTRQGCSSASPFFTKSANLSVLAWPRKESDTMVL